VIEYAGALELILREIAPLSVESIPVAQALHRTLASDIIAPFPSPRFDNSTYDGYALRSAETLDASVETPLPLKIVATVRAGDDGIVPAAPGEVVRIMTGAPVPSDFDAVVMREEVETPDGLMLRRPLQKGESIRFAGEELRSGETALPRGLTLTPPALGMLATFGLTKVDVFKHPAATVIVTGDELTPAGDSLQDGAIYDANGPGLAAALAMGGISSVRLRRAADRLDVLQNEMEAAREETDIILTAGGVSVGDYDLVREAARRAGFEELIWRVAIKPGKPLYFGKAPRPDGGMAYLFGLPGNPVSALVTYHLFVLPALRRMTGVEPTVPPSAKARLEAAIRKSEKRLEFMRGWLDESTGARKATPLKEQESHMLRGLARANCLIHFPREATAIEAGEIVEVTPLRWSR